MRAAIYCRISEDPTGLRAGVDRQEPDCRALCIRQEWQVAEVFVDNDISAYSGKRRPAFERLIAAIEGKSIDAIVTWHPDRLIRHPLELERFIALIERTKVKVASVTAGAFDLSTPTGRAVARTVGAWAFHESEHKGERVRRAAKQRAEQGKLAGGGRRMFGYSRNGLGVVGEEAEMIRGAVRDLVGGGSLRSVVKAWNEGPLRTVGEGRWVARGVKDLLTSPRLAALRVYEGKTIKGNWPAIISEADHEAVVAILSHGEKRPPGRPPVYLLSGIASCGLCGGPLYGKLLHGGRAQYLCLSDVGGCGKIAAYVDRVDEIVWRFVTAEFEAQGPWQETPESGQGNELAGARAKLGRLEDAYLDGLFDKATYGKRRRELIDAITELEGEVFRSLVLPGGDVDVEEWLAAAALETRRDLVRRTLLGVEVGKGMVGKFDPDRVTLLVETVGTEGRNVERVPGSQA